MSLQIAPSVLSRICGKIYHVNREVGKSGIVSHAADALQFRHECQVRAQSGGSRAECRSKAARAAGAAAAPARAALYPQRHDLSGAGAAAARALRQRRRARFCARGKEQTDSRVSLLTGIHRKEVARLRGAGAPVHETPAALSRTSAVIARWLAAPDSPMRGRAAGVAAHGRGRCAVIRALVACVTKDVRPRAVLDEWLDRKLVTIDDDDEIELVEAAFVPSGADDSKWHYLGRNLHDHIAAAAENVSGPAPRFLERAVHYNNISPKLAKRLEARSRELAMDALKTANREANRALAKDKGGDARWNFGIYIYSEDADEEGEAKDVKENGKENGKEGSS